MTHKAVPSEARVSGDALNLDRVVEVLEAVRLAENLPGLVAAVEADGRSARIAIGFRDLDQTDPIPFEERLRLSSMVKPFTAAAVRQLVEAGRLDLDAPVAEHLTSVSVDTRVTARHLLSHTSGLTREGYFHVAEDEWLPSVEEFYAAGSLECSFAPGSSAEYSNHGYAVLGQVVADVVGVPFVEYLRTNVLGPIAASIQFDEQARCGLGFEFDDETDALGIAPNYVPVLSPASGGWATAADVVALPSALCRGALPGVDGYALAANVSPVGQPARAFGWALSDFDGEVVLSHAGGWPGYSGNVAWSPSRGIAVAALINLSAEARGGLGASMISALI